MPSYLRSFFLLACLFIGSSLLADCQSQAQRDESTEQASQRPSRKKHNRHHRKRSSDSYQANTAQSQVKAGQIPQKVYDVLAYVNANGRAMGTLVGGGLVILKTIYPEAIPTASPFVIRNGT